MSEETSSISKGCFLFKPKTTRAVQGTKTKSRRRRPPRKSKQVCTGYKFLALEGENEAQTTLRYKHFHECWTNIHQEIESIQIDMNKKVFDDLMEFIKLSHKRCRPNLPRREIPTAALLTGINMPDHEVMFQQITMDLAKNITSHTVLLHSKDCSNLKFLLRELLTQLMAPNEEGEESADDLDKSCIEDMGKMKHYTLAVLKLWYLRHTKSASDNPPIVIILEDFEGFNQTILQDFILIASEYVNDLPIVLVFSLATTIAAVHKSLPHSVSTKLSMETFHAKPSLECLHEILNKVFLTSKYPFKLGPNMSNLLFDKFLCQDFSIQNFANAVQFSMLEHFYNNPLSILCTHDKQLINDYVQDFSGENLFHVRNSRSFQRFSDRKSLADQRKLKDDDIHLKKIIILMMDDLLTLQLTLFPILRCLHSLSAKLPGALFGKRLKDVYEFILEQEIVSTDVYQNTLTLLRHVARDDLLSALENCAAVLEEAVSMERSTSCLDNFDEYLKQIKIFIDRFNHLDDLQRTETDEQRGQSTPKSTTKKTVYRNRFEFQEQMRQAVKDKKETPYDRLRTDVVHFWDGVFRRFLRCPMKLPLHEVMFFDAKDAVSPHINATPRLAIQTALKDPNHYLQCKCCRIDPEDNQESLPDISIVYKIHLECGRMINLYDWLQAFAEIAEPGQASKKASKKRNAEDEKLQARFIQSVSELQLLGFVKPTKRKTDHVQRLTWGF